MKPRITIITLGVADLPRAIRFYRDGLGFPTDAKDDASMEVMHEIGHVIVARITGGEVPLMPSLA